MSQFEFFSKKSLSQPMCWFFIEGYNTREAWVEEKREGKQEREKENSENILLSLPHLRKEANKPKNNTGDCLIALNVPRLARWNFCVWKKSFTGSKGDWYIFPVFPSSCLSVGKILYMVFFSTPFLWLHLAATGLLWVSVHMARVDLSARGVMVST